MYFLATLALHALAAHAAPVAPAINLYCMVLQPGGPQGPLTVNYGEEKEIGTLNGKKFLVSFREDLALENVVQLRVLDVKSNKQSLALTVLNKDVPARFDLVSEKGNVSCMNTEAWGQ